MSFEDYQTKESVVVVYTGDGKGKTSASLGLMVRALGNRWQVAFIQFIKYWGVGEHVFIRDIQSFIRLEISANHTSAKPNIKQPHMKLSMKLYNAQATENTI
jgi:cob(I)alamin adenosyltransferase